MQIYKVLYKQQLLGA